MHADGLDLGVIEPGFGGPDPPARNAKAGDHLDELVERVLEELLLDLGLCPVHIGREHEIADVAGHPLFVEHVAQTQRLDQPGLELATERAAGDPLTVLRGVARIGGMAPAGAHCRAGIGVVRIDGDRPDRGLHHRLDPVDRDTLAEARAFALDQCRDRAYRRPHPLDIQQMRIHRIDRAAVGAGLPPGHAACGSQQRLRFMAPEPRGGAAIRRKLEDDQPCIARAQHFVGQAERPECLRVPNDADVGAGDQFAQPAALRFVGRIDDDALLAPVPHRKTRGVPAGVACRWLDLHHLRAEVGHEHAGDRAGDPMTEIDYLE